MKCTNGTTPPTDIAVNFDISKLIWLNSHRRSLNDIENHYLRVQYIQLCLDIQFIIL